MFDKYLIVENSLRHTGPADAPTGFAFDARLGYYRGLGLSMIEDLAVSIDGQPQPRAVIRFDDGGGPLSLDEMEQAFDRRWEFGAVATILLDTRLEQGAHAITLAERLRISYLPFPLIAEDSKTMTLSGSPHETWRL